MNNTDFAHLHVHNEFSQLDGFGTAQQYAQRAAKLGFKYLALTNHGNIDGLIKFQQACDNNNIKPILGCEGYIVPNTEDKTKKYGHILLLVKNKTGFKNLCNLLTFANLEGFYYRPRFNFETLLENCKGLVISTACPQSFTRIFKKEGIDLFENLHDEIGDDLYCELMPHNADYQRNTNDLKIKLAKKYDKKIIVTNDCHYIKRGEWKVQELLLAIQRKAKWSDKKRFKFDIKGLYLKSADEMIKALKKQGYYKKKYLLNTIEIAEKCCNYRIPKMDIKLPRVKIGTIKEASFLRDTCIKNYKMLFNEDIKDNRKYYKRFKEEYNLIKKKKFIRYFLIVWELVNWCNENNIPIGPGRGSVGGSLIAMLMGITTVDPIKHQLLFSRFINEDRIDYPDIDIDFEHTSRHLVRKHLEDVYGVENVAGVSSFNRMKSKAVIKDVSRVFEVPFDEANHVTKLIDDGIPDAIQNVVDTTDEGREFKNKYPKVVKLAKKLEGQVRGYGQHAAAIVVSRENIGTCGRCNLLERDNVTIVNWEKDDAEYVGLMKLDALGLKMLSILGECRNLIKQNHDKNISFRSLNLEDKAVLKDINDGNCVGVFQLNTWAMTNLIKQMGISKFDHIAIATALVRPGPANSGMTDEYIRRKNGGKWERKHKIYERITRKTYGLLVYQEQVMEVISKVAGLPYSTADKIRKIIGKKRDVKEFKQYEKTFLNGCHKEKIFTKNEAKEFWKGLQEWALYGFNRSHSVEYAMLGYWCSWLKRYFPTEFICASLTHCAADKKQELVEEAYRLGLNLILPKVNISDPFKWVAKDKNLYIPFIEVNGIGPKKAEEAAILKNNVGIKKFFNKKKVDNESTGRHKGQLRKILEEIGSYNIKQDVQITKEVQKRFKFRITLNPRENYKKLYKLFNDKIRLDRLDPILEGDTKELKKLKGVIRKQSFRGHKNLLSCTKCELRDECTQPVPPSPGKYNIMIVGEAPGKDEDKEGSGFVGRAGKELWNSIKYDRKHFHVTNINKCYPSESRKPSQKQIKLCGNLYLSREIKRTKPIIILAFGNTSLSYFTDKKSGITGMSGKILWNEDCGCWIVYCIHPAAMLHNPENKTYFREGMKSFRKITKTLIKK